MFAFRIVHTVHFFLFATAIYLHAILSHRMDYICRFMEVFTWCNLLCLRCIFVCNVAHQWVPYPSCVIVMCDSSINTLQIATTPIAPCEQFHKISCKVRCRTLSKSYYVNEPLYQGLFIRCGCDSDLFMVTNRYCCCHNRTV